MGMYTVPKLLAVCPLCKGLLEYSPHPYCRECNEEFVYDFEYKVFRNDNIIDISYRDPESSLLSNLYPHYFREFGFKFASMEAFLRSICWDGNLNVIRDEIAPLFGINAINVKYVIPDWRKRQVLYLFGKEIPRDSNEYQDCLDTAYRALFEGSKLYRMALLKTKGKKLIHSCGKDDPKDTLLTKREFIHYLEKYRELT